MADRAKKIVKDLRSGLPSIQLTAIQHVAAIGDDLPEHVREAIVPVVKEMLSTGSSVLVEALTAPENRFPLEIIDSHAKVAAHVTQIMAPNSQRCVPHVLALHRLLPENAQLIEAARKLGLNCNSDWQNRQGYQLLAELLTESDESAASRMLDWVFAACRSVQDSALPTDATNAYMLLNSFNF